jgi:PAS domain S-box-containing protein
VEDTIKLLVVDDEMGMRETLSTIFENKGYSVVSASNGGKAFDIIKKEFFNLVVLDMRLPDMDGIEVLRFIKKESPDTEIVIITAFASLQSSVQALNEGAYAYHMKPFEMDYLINSVEGARERQRLIIENRELRRFNENIVQSLNEGILVEDEKGIIAFINPRIEKLFSLPETKIIGNPFTDFIKEEYRNVIKKRGPSTLSEERFEVIIDRKDETPVPVMVSTVHLFTNDEFTGILSVLTDISEIKSLDKEIKSKLEELEHFNKLMIGRELRMVELKNRIKELEAKLRGGEEESKG